MAQHTFPGGGHDGADPVPADPVRDWAEREDRYMAWFVAEVDAGRVEVPPEDPDADADQAAGDVRSLGDDELFGVMLAARRRQARAEYEELAAVAEFARRREEQFEASRARGDRPRHRDGEFAAEELGMAMNYSHYTAGHRMDLADGLSRRLPATFAGMADGTIDGYKAKLIYEFTRFLPDEQAAEADKILAAAAPGLAPAELRQKAARLEMKLDPAGVRQRKEEAARKHRRVEARQEASGNASLSGRELAVGDALEAKNSVWAEAAALCDAGLGVSLREARALVYLDRLRGLNSWDRLTPPSDPPSDDGYEEDGEDNGGGGGSGGSGPSGTSGQPGSPGGNALLPALTNILIPAGTLLGWSGAPAEVSGYGLTDPESARDLIAAASHHPRSRWCVTILGDDGEAIAHGCSAGPHPWTPARAGPDQRQLDALLRQLAITPAPIAKGTCDHAHREDRYRPSRKLSHLIRARTATCAAPGCNAQAIHSELDHTIPWPAGTSDECNLSPLCARHHHAKHAPGWKLQQPELGVMRWTLPSGRVCTTRPTRYDE